MNRWFTTLICHKLTLITLLISIPLYSTQNTYFIKPTADTPCPGEPCHTLSQYGEESFQNSSSNTTLLFLPGDHTLNFTISVGNLFDFKNESFTSQSNPYQSSSSLTLLGSPSSLPEITSRIVCTWPAGFLFSGITELNITALAFISCGHNDNAAINVWSVKNVGILNCSFQNNTNNRSESSEFRFGGAIHVHSCNLTLTENIFRHNFAYKGGALEIFANNTVTLSRNIFFNNPADYGGSLYAHANNTVTLLDNTFQNNSAGFTGGALFADANNTLTLSGNTFQHNSAEWNGGAFHTNNSNTFTLFWNTFQNNSAKRGGSLHANANNTLTLSENKFQNNSAEMRGGALYTKNNNTFTLFRNTFQSNSAERGGSLHANANNTLTLSENTFQNNSAEMRGGALHTNNNNTFTLFRNTFQSNSAKRGGSLYANASNTLTLLQNIFLNNSANQGGALFENESNTLTLSENTFEFNSAIYGGALYFKKGNIATLAGNTFQDNSVDKNGGAIITKIGNTLNLSENTFRNNSAKNGGALFVYKNNTLTLLNNMLQRNSAIINGGVLVVHLGTIMLINNTLAGNTAESDGGAVFCLRNSTLQLKGSNRLQNNTAVNGGAIAALGCQIVLAGDTVLENNTASYGGGLYSAQSKVSGCAHFKKNCAHRSGGGIYATSSVLYISQYITFVENSAQNGGGLLLDDDSKLYLQPNTSINFTNNFAQQKGGAIKVVKDNALSHCVEESCEFLIESDCFFQIQTKQQYNFRTNVTEITELQDIRMCFQNNTALEAGAMLYGGSVDSCSLSFIELQNEKYNQVYRCPSSGEVFDYITSVDGPSQDISSDPLYICSCEGGEPDCSKPSITISVYPGGRIEVPIIAYGQRNGTTPAVVNMITPGGETTTKESEKTQNITKGCNSLKYTVQTRKEGSKYGMILHVGPCAAKERNVLSGSTNVITVHVTVLECPPGFELSSFQPLCKCAQRLEQYTNACRIADSKIERGTNHEFWVGYKQDNESDGLILHPHCPFDYCTSNKMDFTVDDSDEQCSNNRTGLLCGKCTQNFSLALGTNRCLQCSNNYLWLIVAFAFAGVALVLLLLVLRLTVAVGTINGLIFYANIIANNSATFFTPQTNVLTVFIAWLNLDLGIETCFIDGMDAYTKAWLQFVFPFYVWALVGIIILISHYSSKVATILGTNPTAVLATLFLLSYTKFLRAIIVALSNTTLEYPNKTHISVWLYDANITYFSKKHVPLFTTALFSLIVLFLPYTVFLIFSQWLRSKSGQYRILSWVNHYRVIPFLEAYHAPYTDKHRYWTGLMLLVRCTLFLLFALNALEDPSVNLLAISSVTVILLIVYAMFGNRIYKTWYLNVLELSFIVNLCILDIATFYIRSTGGNQNAVTFTSVSVAFATFVGIVIYHSAQQIKHSPQLWRRIFPRNSSYEPFPQVLAINDTAPPRPRDPSDGCATVSHINIRELLAKQNDSGFRESCLVILDD